MPMKYFSKNLLTSKNRTELERFNHEQTYEGDFLRDSFHGQGRYEWKNVGVYEGGFFSNCKEGYANFSFLDGSCFEGLFIKDRPFGPGILTYSNGRQDAGFWLGRKLVRLSRAVDFIIPRLAPSSAAKIKLLQFRRLITLDEKIFNSATDILEKHEVSNCYSSPFSNFIYDPRSLFFDNQVFNKTYFTKQPTFELPDTPTNGERSFKLSSEEAEQDDYKETFIPPHCRCSKEVFQMIYHDDEFDICEKESVKGEFEMGILTFLTKYGGAETYNGLNEESEEEDTETKEKSKIVSWNRSELCTEMLKQIFKYRDFEEKLTFDLGQLMLGVRTAFRRTGEKEKQCVQFLKMCSLGPPQIIKELLCNYEISEELMDARGNNSLMFASATDQHKIMDLLLDYGVDVNTFNDEGLTPLNLCLLRRLAVANDICSWESAFLPREIDKAEVEDTPDQPETWNMQQSIPSLDRIFGDGMSISDKSQILDTRFFSLLPTYSFAKQPCIPERTKSAEAVSKQMDIEKSQVTLLNMPKSPGSYSLVLHQVGEDVNSPDKNGNAVFVRENAGFLKKGGSSEQMFKKNDKIVPKSVKRDEFEKSIMQSKEETYFFGFSLEKPPKKEVVRQESKGKTTRTEKQAVEKEMLEEIKEVDETNDVSVEIKNKIVEIDKTIRKLLERGANPNISEVPKPSIHLAVYTKNLEIVETLLQHGADANSKLYLNEGLLTPLHVLVLQKPLLVFVEICKLLLKFGGNSEQETSPEFSMCEEEKQNLVEDQGRTPLQLLCMRPDVEYADPNDYLIQIGQILAKASEKRRYYNGHSYLTLAMFAGNLKLLKALLDIKHFDPNDILECDRGTTLHVLVSTEFQKKTSFDTSIKMCDLLLEAGANPNKKFRSPVKLYGTCVDYGYREIDAVKETRKFETPIGKESKKSTGRDKPIEKDYLKDHERVVEYLKGRADEKRKKKSQLSSEVEDEGNKVPNLEITKVNAKEKAPILETKASGKEEKIQSSNASDKVKAGMEEKIKAATQEREKPKADSKQDLKSGRKRDSSEKEDKPKVIFEKPEKIQKQKPTKSGQPTQDKPKPTESGKLQMKKELELKSKMSESVTGKSSQKKFGCRSETFPEKLRQTLLQMYGACGKIDVNEFIVPYVVLRNGELYYKFKGKASNSKEQYSLI